MHITPEVSCEACRHAQEGRGMKLLASCRGLGLRVWAGWLERSQRCKLPSSGRLRANW